MLVIKHQVKTKVSPNTIWQLWEDVENWNTWDDGIEFSKIDGPFKTGTTGTLKPKGGPVIRTKLSHVEPGNMFTDESKLPMARIIFTHTLSQAENATIVTHQIEIKGLLSYLFFFLIGRKMKQNLPSEMEKMIKKAEELET